MFLLITRADPVININSNFSVAGPFDVSSTAVATPVITESTITGTAVNTLHLHSSSALAQPVSPAHSAQHSFPRFSAVSAAAVHYVVMDTAQRHSSTLEATTSPATVTSCCTGPVMSVSERCSSVINQSSVQNIGGKIRGSEQLTILGGWDGSPKGNKTKVIT